MSLIKQCQSIIHVIVMTQEKLIEKTDAAIAELVYPKKELKKAYNYYHGILDPE